MYTIDNKFEIGEECYSVYRKPVDYKCPVCEGNGKFLHNGYEVWCRNCNGTGKLHNSKQYVMATCKVRVKKIVVTMYNSNIAIKYKVYNIDDPFINVNNRSETTLFKTIEEAEKYCVDVNTEQITPEF